MIDLTRALPYLSPVYSAEETAPLVAIGGDSPIRRSFSNTLVVHYMIDEPGAAVFVRERDVELDDRDELHARAIDNLRGYTARRRLRFEPRGALQSAKLDGEHDSSLLLLDELWDAPSRIFDPEGELIAAVPERGALLFGGSGARSAVDEMRGWLARASLSPELLVRRGRLWETFEG